MHGQSLRTLPRPLSLQPWRTQDWSQTWVTHLCWPSVGCLGQGKGCLSSQAGITLNKKIKILKYILSCRKQIITQTSGNCWANDADILLNALRKVWLKKKKKRKKSVTKTKSCYSFPVLDKYSVNQGCQTDEIPFQSAWKTVPQQCLLWPDWIQQEPNVPSEDQV